MAQHDYVIANGTGAAVRSDLNNALAAIVSQNSGATAPATTYAFQFWADTTTGLLKLRNSANSAWITLFQLDGEWSTLPVENGTAAAPSIYFKDSGTDTGFYSPGTDQVGISTGGTARLTIDANGNLAVDTNSLYVDAANNRVGIGTSSPADALHVVGKIAVTGTNPSIRQTVQTANLDLCGGTTVGTDSSIQLYGSSSPSDANHTFYNSNVHIWRNAAGSTQYGRFDSSGRLGIGTTSPQKTLSVSKAGAEGVEWSPGQSSNLNTEVHYNRSGAAFCGISTQAAYHIFDLASSEAARIDTSGRLLVGTSSSTSTDNNANNPYLQVEGTTSDAARAALRLNSTTSYEAPVLYLARSRGTTTGSKTLVSSGDRLGTILFEGSDGTYDRGAALIQCEVDATPGAGDMPGRLVFSTTLDGASSPTERMRITNSGNVLIGTTSTTPNPGIVFSPGFNAQITIGHDNTSGSGQYYIPFYYNGGLIGGVTQNGTTAVAYNTTSDYRLKENVTAVTDGIVRLQQLKPCKFNFIAEPDRTVDGFIAHEVQEVIPEAITGVKDAEDEDGNPIYQGIDQSKLVPLLTAALQEAVAKIESLEARLTAAGI